MVVILMGVTGVGKTTVGRMLAGRLAWPFLDADDLHPPSNVAKIRRGEGLEDADREPWISAVADHVREWVAAGRDGVVACSALRREHRRRLRVGGDVRFVHLHADPAVLDRRLRVRSHPFADERLLPSQLESLEAPEEALGVETDAEPAVVVGRVIAALGIQAA